MKKCFGLFILLFISINAFSQEEKIPEGWDKILLEGKVAYMNLITGDVSKTKPTKAAKKAIEKKEFDPTITHKVKKGETLSTIARKYNLGLDKLYRLNSMTNFDVVEIDDEVVVGYAKNEEEKAHFINKGNSSSLVDKKHHTVISGETLYSVARAYKISVNKIKELNSLKSNTIFVGQKLKIDD